jgi:MtN3 and saliva related transmembrane protein
MNTVIDITVLGLVAAFCTSISFLPQAVKTYKTKKTKDISLPMYSLLVFGIVLWFIYGIYINALPVILANGVSFVFTSFILMLKLKNG